MIVSHLEDVYGKDVAENLGANMGEIGSNMEFFSKDLNIEENSLREPHHFVVMQS